MRKVALRQGEFIFFCAFVACSGDANSVTGSSSNFFGTGTVTPTAVASITLNPPSMSGKLGASVQLSAVAKNSKGDLLADQSVIWTSSDSTIVAISSTGLATNVGIGTATITATANDGVFGSATQTVVGAAPIASIAVTPAQVSVGIGQATQFSVTLRDSAGNILTGRRVLWQSSNSSIMQVDTTGVGTSISQGTVTISGASASVTGTATAVVSIVLAPPASVASVTVTPAAPTAVVGSAGVQFSAVLKDASGTVLTGRVVTWSSSTPSVATISASGLATSVAAGTTTITATSDTVSGTTRLTVTAPPPPPPAPVASVTVTPAAPTAVVESAGVQFSAVLKDANGTVLTGRTITWSSSSPSVATISASGLATSVAAGTTTITATSGAASGTSTLTVTAAPPPPPPANGPYANQPAGLTRFAEIDFSALPGAAGTPGTLAGNFSTWQSPTTHFTVVSDPTAPQSPGGVLQMDYEQGTPPGYSTAAGYRLFDGWDLLSQTNNTEYSEFYESTQFKIPTADFETQMVGVKILGYWGVGVNNTGAGAAQMWSLIGGNGSSNIPMSSWNLHMAYLNADAGGVALYQNVNTSTKVTAGVWHHFEMYAKLNNIGSANGIWKWWLDGVLIGDYENLTFINNSKPSGFFGRHMDGVWGGGGGTAKTRTDHVWFDHMYLSGVFLR